MSSEKYIPTHKVSEEAVNLIADDRCLKRKGFLVRKGLDKGGCWEVIV